MVLDVTSKICEVLTFYYQLYLREWTQDHLETLRKLVTGRPVRK